MNPPPDTNMTKEAKAPTTPTPEQGAAHRSEAEAIVAGWLVELWATRPAWLAAMPDAAATKSLIDRIAALKQSAPMGDRDKALEEAAKVADEVACDHKGQATRWRESERRDQRDDADYERFARNNMLEAEAAERIATAIRALKHSPAPPKEPT